MMSLRDVVREIRVKQLEIDRLDNELRREFVRIEQKLRQRKVTRVINVRIVEGVDLGWSRDRVGWRLVIRDHKNETVTRLLECEPTEWLEVIQSGALAKLVRRAWEHP